MLLHGWSGVAPTRTNLKHGFNRLFVVLTPVWIIYCLFVYPMQRHAQSFENTFFTGECIGYVQGAVDVSLAMADNVKWFNVCVPDSTSTQTVIQKFIAFADRNPKYALASTAFQLMLGQEFPCKK